MTLQGVAAAVGDLPATATLKVVRAIHEIARQEAARVAGSDLTLSNVGRAGATLSTTDDYRASGANATATVRATPPGVWSWMTDGTAPHHIAAKRGRRGRPGVLIIGGRVVTGPVMHPGIRGQRAWTTVRRRSIAEARGIYQIAFARAVRGG